MAFRERWVDWTPNFLIRLFASPYVAGNSLQSAMELADALYKRGGVMSTLDLLGEGIRHRDDISAEVDEYLRMLQAIDEREHLTVSLKPTQMGLALDPELCYVNVRRIVQNAHDKNIGVTIDMEESHYVDPTLSMYRRLREEFDNVGTVLQSRLFRTEEDVDRYLNGVQAHIRLCLGIYKEPAEIAYQDKPAMKENFLVVLEKLLEAGHYTCIATHDEALLKKCMTRVRERQLPLERFEVQMLLGVPREQVIRQLRQEGVTVRLYMPYATTWEYAYAYLKRRMVENPHMILYVLKDLFQRGVRSLPGR